jgi:hypothetical protein
MNITWSILKMINDKIGQAKDSEEGTKIHEEKKNVDKLQ